MKFFLPLLLSALASGAELIPAARLVPWTPGTYTGVPGGIPTNWTKITNAVTALGIDNTGATNISAAVQAWVDLYHSQSNVLYFPAGTYLSSGFSFNNAKGQIIFRGAGTNTIFVMTNSAPFIAVTGLEGAAAAITESVLLKGATNFGLADTSEIMEPGLGRVTIPNNFEFVGHTYGYTNGQRRQIVRILTKTATNITFWPPLYDNYTNASFAQLANETHNHKASKLIGVEDMLIEAALGSGWLIYFSYTDSCWVKNVRIHNYPSYAIRFEQSLNGEIRDCWADERTGVGSNGAGMLFDAGSGMLVENNIVDTAFPLIEVNSGTSGSVFGYNYMLNSTQSGSMEDGINANHGPYNQFNLYEGNVAPNIKSDGYFGGSGNDTAFRNWFKGTDVGANDRRVAVNLRRFTRQYSIVGNVLGTTNFTWIYSNTNSSTSYADNYIYQIGSPLSDNGGNNGLFAPPWTGDDGTVRDFGVTNLSASTSAAWVTSSAPVFVNADVATSRVIILDDSAITQLFGTFLNSTNAPTVNPFVRNVTNEHFRIAPGPNGFGAMDTNVFATVILKGNWNYASNTVPPMESLGGDTLPDSLYLAAKPSWYGSLVWPAHTPAASTMLSPIPAENRYNGVADVLNTLYVLGTNYVGTMSSPPQ